MILIRKIEELEDENDRLRGAPRWTYTLRVERERDEAQARVAVLEEALRGAMKKLQRYGEQTEDESAALARPTTAHAPVGTNIVKCPCGRLHARSSGCPCGCATTPTP